MSHASPVRQATSLFQERFGSGPTVVASAPGRVNLLGEHTDYNGGPVLPFALDRRTVVAAAQAERWEAISATDNEVHALDPECIVPGLWTGYLVAVIRILQKSGIAMPTARLAVASSVPVGAGLSSSAALTVAAARALTGLAGRRVPPGVLAEVAYRAEHDEVGVHCGHMDQTIAALGRAGHAMLFETASGTVHHLPLPGRVWVFDTGVSHRLTGGHLNERRRECEEALRQVIENGVAVRHLAEITEADLPALLRAIPAPWNARIRHVVTETIRTRAAAHALAARDLPGLGRLMLEGHESLRADYQSSCAEADLLVESLVHHGALGARLTGAGWGGAVIALLPEEKTARIVAEVQEAYRGTYGRVPLVWATTAGAGVRSEK
ncbi:MAG: galactokinase [Gemmatimonadota bacterium]